MNADRQIPNDGMLMAHTRELKEAVDIIGGEYERIKKSLAGIDNELGEIEDRYYEIMDYLKRNREG